MNLLVDGKYIIDYAHKITFGIYDEPFEKWRLANEKDILLYYVIDNGYEVVKNVTMPNDYEDGKYFYENGGFVLNEDWKPYVPIEKKVEILETESSITQNTLYVQEEEIVGTQLALAEQYETNMVMEAELVSTQLALAEQYEVNIALEEELTASKNEIVELQLAICDLYEAMLG